MNMMKIWEIYFCMYHEIKMYHVENLSIRELEYQGMIIDVKQFVVKYYG